MDFHELIINRRSIRKYTDEPIAQEDVRLILEAALLSPTSKSARAWQLVAIEDKSTLEQLAACKPAGAMSVAGCPLAIAVTVDSTKSEAWVEDASVAASYMQLQATGIWQICSRWNPFRPVRTGDTRHTRRMLGAMHYLIRTPE